MDVTGWVAARTCGDLIGLSVEEVESVACEDTEGRFQYRLFTCDIEGTAYASVSYTPPTLPTSNPSEI